ncbi:HU family DNA-binding protein [Reichenbachiella ulvae]|uniref:HU family DNA-binding protein n=1 Tax=Reichenbachiella ulvae TaxID=2980104 RepID=A0ABT3CX44_9BACT|nr:HU family DNA-binding protein [Reichenbachiella ulvae]MCV9388133.1 HU family DNA-binding protein [Reichenbachiella ulvae]
MPIKFNVIERGQPGVAGGGQKKYYASAKMSGELDIDQLTKSIERTSTVNGADIRAVLYSLVEVASEELSRGNIVRLGDLGSMRVSISSEGLPTEEEVTANAIKSSKVLFTPGKRLKEMQKVLEYQKA